MDEHDDGDGQEYGKAAILQEMSVCETGSLASLFILWEMCVEDGSSLSVAGNMRWTSELQAIYTLLGIHESVLLVGIHDLVFVGLDGYHGC